MKRGILTAAPFPICGTYGAADRESGQSAYTGSYCKFFLTPPWGRAEGALKPY